MKVFETVAEMKLARLRIGQLVKTKGYVTSGDGGGAVYWIAANQAVDGYGDHLLANNNVALIQSTEICAKSYSATGNGTTLDQAAFTAMIDAQASNGKAIKITTGTYLINSSLIEHDHAEVIFEGDVTLKANSANSILFHQAASFANHSGIFRTDSNSLSGVEGMACAPADLTQTDTLVQNNNNIMPGLIGDHNLELCIRMQAGPDIGGSDSGCFYNVIPFCRGNGAVGMIRLFNPSNVAGSPCNRNKFYNCRMGTSGGVSANFGLWIEAGDTNNFHSCDFEGVGSGTPRTSPIATPTAIKIDEMSAAGADNNHNSFYGGFCEANTRDLDIANRRTYLFGLGYSDTKAVFVNGGLFKTLPAVDSSVAKLHLNGFAALDEQNIIFEGQTLGDDNGSGGRYNWQRFDIDNTNVTQGGSMLPELSTTRASYYRRLFKMVKWHCRFKFRANTAGGDVDITLPVNAKSDLYANSSQVSEMRVPIRITDGTTEQNWYGVLFANILRIPSPGTWDTAGFTNQIWFTIDYSE